jgi:hypothetical protein
MIAEALTVHFPCDQVQPLVASIGADAIYLPVLIGWHRKHAV